MIMSIIGFINWWKLNKERNMKNEQERKMKDFILSINNNKLYISAAIVVIGIIVYEIIKKTINKILEKDKQRNKLDKKGRTVVSNSLRMYLHLS